MSLSPRPSDARSEKVVSTTRRFLWVGVPKAATRSMLQLLVRDPPVDLQAEQLQASLAEVFEAHPEWRDFYVFTFVRNPWSRVVSAWKDKLQNANPDKEKAILNRFDELEAGMPFDAFVDFLVSDAGSDARADRHWLSQHRFLRDADGEVAVDFVGRMERISSDFPQVAERIGVSDIDLPVLNTRFGWRPDGDRRAELRDRTRYWHELYTDRTRDLVAERYAEDIALFGYDF